MKKIDIFAHILPEKFLDYCSKYVENWGKIEQTGWITGWPALCNIDKRLEIMDRYEDYVQVLLPPGPSGFCCAPEEESNMARVFNDATAEIVSKYPHKFVGAVAYLPLHNIDATLKEIDRAIDELGFRGICLETPVYKVKAPDYEYDPETIKPLDLPEFMPIYENMSRRKLPIWIHPVGEGGVPVYPGERSGKYGLFLTLGWTFESAMAMTRLACSGILAKYPDLRIIIHHCGSGVVPVLAGRIDGQMEVDTALGMKWGHPGEEDPFQIKRPVDYLRMFYADTALYGDTAGLMCGHAFFGPEHILFGTDFPWDVEGGDKYVRTTIDAVYRMNISDADKEKIFEGNAKRLLRLPG
ncbi:amidohydrolase family protein [Chloroflexota bacterium]